MPEIYRCTSNRDDREGSSSNNSIKIAPRKVGCVGPSSRIRFINPVANRKGSSNIAGRSCSGVNRLSILTATYTGISIATTGTNKKYKYSINCVL